MVSAALGTSTGNLILAVGISGIPQFVSITRAAVLTAKEEDYRGLIADEPTSALDVTIQAQILDLLQRL